MQGSVEYGMVFNRHLPGGVVKTGCPKNFRKFPSKTLINHSYFGKFAELKCSFIYWNSTAMETPEQYVNFVES